MKKFDEFLPVAKEVALEAGSLLKENIAKEEEIFFKGAVDLVTNSDRQSQDLIFHRLSSYFPNHAFLAEEDLFEDKGSEFRWVIDPLDGTTNYAHKFPIFCVSIGLEHGQEVVLGVVYDPMREEMFWAVKGKGSFLNGKRLKVSQTSRLEQSLIATGFPYDVRESKNNNLNHFSNFLVRAQAIRRCGSAALDLCYVACGRFDGFWEIKLNPWDVAAGGLIVLEAGGRVTDFQNGSFSIYNKQVLATNGLIHGEMLGVLNLARMR